MTAHPIAVGNCISITVPKLKLAEDGEYNLTAGRYQEHTGFTNCVYDLVKLGDVAEIINGGTPDTKIQENWNGDIEWITPAEMDDSKGIYITQSKRKISKLGLENSSAHIIPKGSVILSTRAPIGYLKINENPTAFNQGCRGIIPKKDILLSKFLYFYLLTQRENLNSLGTGATFKELSATMLKQFKIPLPPLETQKQIVAEIENKQQAIDNARRTIDLLEREREYFGSSLNGVKYEEVMLSEVCEIKYGFTDSAKEKGNTRFIRITDIDNNGKLKEEDKKYLDLNKENKEYLLKKNDLLVARTGATFGKTLIFTSDEPAIYASYLIK